MRSIEIQHFGGLICEFSKFTLWPRVPSIWLRGDLKHSAFNPRPLLRCGNTDSSQQIPRISEHSESSNQSPRYDWDGIIEPIKPAIKQAIARYPQNQPSNNMATIWSQKIIKLITPSQITKLGESPTIIIDTE